MNKLELDDLRKIVAGAPEGATHYLNKYIRFMPCSVQWFQDFYIPEGYKGEWRHYDEKDFYKVASNIKSISNTRAIIKQANRIAELEANQSWINANDSLPEDTDHILIIDNTGQGFSGSGAVFNKKLSARDAGEGFKSSYYTKWMLFPSTKQAGGL